jgi:hypothetical protein
MWDVWWTEWHWDRFLSESFGFPLSVSFHRCSIFTHVSSGGWTMGPLAAAVQQRHSLTPSKKKKLTSIWITQSLAINCLNEWARDIKLTSRYGEVSDVSVICYTIGHCRQNQWFTSVCIFKNLKPKRPPSPQEKKFCFLHWFWYPEFELLQFFVKRRATLFLNYRTLAP